jgi:hypothetical protein
MPASFEERIRSVIPEGHFIDAREREKPLVVREVDGRPVWMIESDGSLGAYHQDPDPRAPRVHLGG